MNQSFMIALYQRKLCSVKPHDTECQEEHITSWPWVTDPLRIFFTNASESTNKINVLKLKVDRNPNTLINLLIMLKNWLQYMKKILINISVSVVIGNY